MPQITVGFKTDVGRVRTQNQDSLAVVSAEELGGRAQGLFIVADGVGGNRKGGEVASRIAVDTITDAVRSSLTAADTLPVAELEALLHASLKAANAAVWQQAHRVYEQHGMGTTCVLALLRDADLIVGNVGDSRCYLLRKGRLDQLTHDHAFLDLGRGSRRSEGEAGNHMQFRHIMTRAIGYASVVEPEVEPFCLREGDAILLCSDGLTRMLDHAEITNLMTAGAMPQEICKRLVAAANAKGGDDNITAIVIHYGAVTPPAPTPVSPGSATPQSESNADNSVSAETPTRSWRRKLHRLLKRQH